MSKINIHRGTFLEKEELTRMITFLDENPMASAVIASSVSFGLVSPGYTRGVPFRVSLSGTLGAINMIGGYVITPDFKAYKVDDQENLAVPADGKYYWLKVSPTTRNYEKGYAQVDTSGNVSGTVNFEGVVRGQSSGVPTCIKFVKDDGTTPLNNQVYQVVNIINNNNIVLSSGYPFQAETQLRVVVLGSIPMGRRFTEEQLQGLYTFNTYNLSFVLETQEGTQPTKAVGEYFIVRVRNVNGIVEILEERTEFWSLGGGSVGEYYTFAINPIPSDARVVINGNVTSSVRVPNGSTCVYSVSKSGYVTKTGTETIKDGDKVISVQLEEDPTPTLITVSAITSTGDNTEGYVSINNTTINKAYDEVKINQGTEVVLRATPASGYQFIGWRISPDAELVPNNPLKVAPAGTINYTAYFQLLPDDEFWDFEVKLPTPVGEVTHELLEVPVSSGSTDTEGVMVRIKEIE